MQIIPIKIAVVGCGAISDIYLQNMIERFAILEVVGCAATTMESAKKKADKYHIKAMSVQEICEDKSIELVVNLTPPGAHYEIIKQLLNAGKNVYTEKVFTVTLEQAKELADIARKKNLYLGVAPDTFLGSGIQTAREIIDNGMIGEVTSCVAVINRDNKGLTKIFPFLAGVGSGIGFDVGIYYVTALLSILGPVKKVNGMVKENTNNEILLTGTALFENGVIGSLHFNGKTIFPEDPILTIYGTQGIVYLPDPNGFGGEVKVLRKGQNVPVCIPGNYGFSDNSRGLGVAELAWSMKVGRKPRVGYEMAYHALELLHGIVSSSHTGKQVVLESSFEKTPALQQGFLNREYLNSNEEEALR